MRRFLGATLGIFASAALMQGYAQPGHATVLMTEDIGVFANDTYGPDERERGFSIAKYMGTHAVRLHLGRDTTFTWGPIDRFVDRARARGLQPFLTLTHRRRHRDAPDPTFMPIPTPASFGSWCREAALRYSGRVIHYSVWNEPNYFGDGMTPTVYNQLFRACAGEIRAADPNATVTYGEIAADADAPDPCGWVTQSLSSSSPTIADGIAIHTYQWTVPPTQQVPGLCRGIGRLGDWNSLRQFWFQNGQSLRTPANGVPPLLITEHGYCAPHGECPPSAGAANRLSETTRAQWARDAFDVAEQHGVGAFSYYHLYNQPDAGSRWDSGIVTTNGDWTPSVESIRAATGATQPYVDPFRYRTYAFADVNGDDRADAVKMDSGVPVAVRLSTGTSFGNAHAWTDVPYSGDRGGYFADVTGDGRADAAVANQWAPIVVRRSNGVQFTPNEDWSGVPYLGDRGNYFADVTGDGRSDAIVANQYTPLVVRRSTGSSFGGNEDWTGIPFLGTHGNFFADVTGDGKADAIVANDWTPTIVRRSTGTSFAANEAWTSNVYLGDRGNYFSDVTGDGRADAIVVNDSTPIVVRRSDGNSFTRNEAWTDIPFVGNRGNYFADVTGDGKDDAIVMNDQTPIVVKRSSGNGFGPNEAWTGDPF